MDIRTFHAKRRKLRPYRPAAPVRRKLRPVQKAAVTAVVKKVIKGQEEKKFVMSTSGPTNFNCGISSTAEWYNCVPDMVAGTASYQRVGCQVKPTLLDLNWHIGFDSTITRSCDDVVVLYVFKCKNLNSYNDMVSRGSASTFLETGFGTNQAFTGYTKELSFPVDNSLITLIAKRTVRLRKGVGYLNGDTTTGTSADSGTMTYKHINVKVKKLPTFKYDVVGTDTQPDNYGLCWAIGYAKTDGSAPDVINQDIQVQTAHKLYYTDA